MPDTRAAAVAGTFYPAEPVVLQEMVDQCLVSPSQPAAAASGNPKVIVAPHAGYIYSGTTAGAVYQSLREKADSIRRVVLLGPSHRVAFKGIAASTATHFETPLGAIPVDAAAILEILHQPGVGLLDAAHAEEHSLEVHLPFCQRLLGDFRLVPLVVGDAPPEQVAAVLDQLWGGEETLIIISTDLSHFLDYRQAQRKDAQTVRKILHLDATLTGEEACGARPVNGLLRLLQQRRLTIELVGHNNSGDTAGDRERVVGYGAFLVTEQTGITLAHKQLLLHVARLAIEAGLDNVDLQLPREHWPASIQAPGACFVTLKSRGQLRGCIGSLEPHRSLLADVAANAHAAAFRDPRFARLTREEYLETDLHLSIVGKPSPLPVSGRNDLEAKLRPGRDGLIIAAGGKRATFLPSVWDELPRPRDFVGALLQKAGLPRDGWPTDATVQRYETEGFS